MLDIPAQCADVVACMNYLERVQKAGSLLPIREVTVVSIAHDSSCPILRHEDTCNCVPEITFKVGKKSYVVDTDGVANLANT